MALLNLTPVPFHQVHINSPFWSQKIQTIRQSTTRYCLKRCEETGRIANFRRAAGLEEGGFEGIYFNDSDVYKVLEGVAYALQGGRDPELEAAADEVISAVCAAQQADGYLFTYYTLTRQDKRWRDMGYHEDYCLGHMLEGAIAYYQATGKDQWLNAAIRALKQMMTVIGPGKKHWVTGHQELELALMRLYRLTGEAQYLAYAQWLVDERGRGHLDSPDFARQNFHSDYCQDDRPARELQKVTGHAVRAMYYYTGIADIAAVTGDQDMADALVRLWHNVVPANLYITGGIGQDSANEGFTRDWHLPNLTAYCETCASIGMALWNQRMGLLFGDAKYADLVETEIYNGILSGISMDGLRFFYDNPLASVGKYQRSEWFGCSCCPTNLVRFIPSISGYAYATDGDQLYINQYIAGDTEMALGGRKVRLKVETQYPWDGSILIRPDVDGGAVPVKLRIPGWCEDYTLTLDGQTIHSALDKGYLSVAVPSGAALALTLQMPVRRIHDDPRVKENAGRAAFARGPVIYCAEEQDQDADIPTEFFHADFAVNVNEAFEPCTCPEWHADMVALRAKGKLLIPYHAWANRGRGGMVVWIKERT